MTPNLDTSGRVECPASFQLLGWAIWSDLDPFMQGYVEQMFASVQYGGAFILPTPDGESSFVTYFPKFTNLAPETVERIITDCVKFQKTPADWVVFDALTGADFWRDRNAHQLTRRSTKLFPPLTLAMSDAGKVVFA